MLCVFLCVQFLGPGVNSSFLLSGKQFPSDGLIEPLNIGILMRCFNVFLELIGINE